MINKTNRILNLTLPMTLSASLLSVLLLGTNASAQTTHCTLPEGTSLTGEYIQSSVVDSNSKSGIALKLKQNGCELSVSTSLIESFISMAANGKMKSNIQTAPGGTWVLDLTGAKPAVIPASFIKANSIDAKSTAMTKSLVVKSKLNDDGSVTITALFDFEHDGTVVRMSTLASFKTSGGSVGYVNQKFSGSLNLIYPGVKIEVVPSAELAEKSGARNLVLTKGANWILDALQGPLNRAVGASSFFFLRK